MPTESTILDKLIKACLWKLLWIWILGKLVLYKLKNCSKKVTIIHSSKTTLPKERKTNRSLRLFFPSEIIEPFSPSNILLASQLLRWEEINHALTELKKFQCERRRSFFRDLTIFGQSDAQKLHRLLPYPQTFLLFTWHHPKISNRIGTPIESD